MTELYSDNDKSQTSCYKWLLVFPGRQLAWSVVCCTLTVNI